MEKDFKEYIKPVSRLSFENGSKSKELDQVENQIIENLR